MNNNIDLTTGTRRYSSRTPFGILALGRKNFARWNVEFQGQTEIKKWRPLLKLGLVVRNVRCVNFSPQGLEGSDLVDDLIDGPLVFRLVLLTQNSDEASLEVLHRIVYWTLWFIAFIFAGYLEPMQVLRVVGVPKDKLAHGSVDAAARLLGTQI